MKDHNTTSAQETHDIGNALGKTLPPNTVIALFGELGSGKTTFLKGLISALSSDIVTSPTFTYLHIHGSVYHFDLYRLKTLEQFLALGFDEYLQAGGICCIEWAERIAPLLPPDTLRITLEHQGGDRRKISIAP